MEEPTLTEKDFKAFRELVYRLTGIALADTKRQMLASRLGKRLRHHNLKGYDEYYAMVAAQGEGGEEITQFINCVTTNKTDFFREPHHFEFIANKLLPHKIRQADRGEAERRLRIWHAGCSTGEEPYTLAMTLAEALEGRGAWDVRQLASDIDTSVLSHAERGVYEQERVEPVPERLLKKYFLRGKGSQDGYVKVGSQLREYLTFKRINLLDELWPINPNVQFDIIFCRNVVIYFDKPTRQRLFARFAERLSPGGYLFIGHSESLLGISEAFDSLGGTIYRLPEFAREEIIAA